MGVHWDETNSYCVRAKLGGWAPVALVWACVYPAVGTIPEVWGYKLHVGGQVCKVSWPNLETAKPCAEALLLSWFGEAFRELSCGPVDSAEQSG